MQAGLANLPQKLGDTNTLKRAVQYAKVTLRTEAQGLLPIITLEYVYGFDISNWQPTINWIQIAENAPDLKYVFIKATEGTGYISPTFKAQWDGAGSISQLRGAYHYLHTELSGKAQANYFMAHASKGELPPVFDAEDADHLPAYPTTAQAKAAGQSVYEFTDTVANAWGQKVVIYTGSWFWNRLAIYAQAASKSCDYFGATYHALDDVGPYLSMGWSTWTLWQYSSKGKLTGCPDYVDLSVFHGGADAFNKWHGGTVVVPPPLPIPVGYPFNAHVHNPIYGMYVRSQPRADSTTVKWIPDGYQLAIFEEKKDATGQSWGRMQFGWINMRYCVSNSD